MFFDVLLEFVDSVEVKSCLIAAENDSLFKRPPAVLCGGKMERVTPALNPESGRSAEGKFPGKEWPSLAHQTRRKDSSPGGRGKLQGRLRLPRASLLGKKGGGGIHSCGKGGGASGKGGSLVR